MRTIIVLVAGILIGVSIESGLAQQARGPQRGSRVGVAGSIVGLNHVAVSVADYKGAIDGSPCLTYFQSNRDTFVEVMQATPAHPAGCPHFGLEVEHLELLEFGSASLHRKVIESWK